MEGRGGVRRPGVRILGGAEGESYQNALTGIGNTIGALTCHADCQRPASNCCRSVINGTEPSLDVNSSAAPLHTPRVGLATETRPVSKRRPY